MKVRGTPAIAIVGSLSLAVELRKLTVSPETKKDLHSLVKEKLDYLVTSRPTAVNMQLAAEACVKLSNDLVEKYSMDAAEAKNVIVKHLEAMLANDIADNLAIEEHKMWKQGQAQSVDSVQHRIPGHSRVRHCPGSPSQPAQEHSHLLFISYQPDTCSLQRDRRHCFLSTIKEEASKRKQVTRFCRAESLTLSCLMNYLTISSFWKEA